MPIVNILLDKVKAELSHLLPGEYSLCEICSRDMNGIGFLEIILKQTI